jgi:hypothetical protein
MRQTLAYPFHHVEELPSFFDSLKINVRLKPRFDAIKPLL